MASLILVLLIIHISSEAQQLEEKSDSVKEVSMQITPYLTQNITSSNQFLVRLMDSSAFHLSSGISLFNALRGKIPNLSIPAYAPGATAGLRSINSSLIVDGIPFYNLVTNYLPFNGFDYSSISSISNSNSLAALDGLQDGTLILQSKSGQGFNRPTFEINSFTTYGYGDISYFDFQNGALVKSRKEDWSLSNAVSYQQDFGKIDTRISYSLNARMGDGSNGSKPTNHNIKINTGMEISEKFSIRILLDNNLRNDNYTSTDRSSFTTRVNTHQNFFSSNVALKYKLNRVVRLSSQLSYADLKTDNFLKNNQVYQSIARNNNRFLGNLFANVQKQVSQFKISAFGGMQYSLQKELSNLTNNTLESSYKSSLNNSAIALGGEVSYKETLFANIQYRLNQYSSLPPRDNQKSNYSVGTAFLFSKLINQDFLSLGKLRATFGKSSPWLYAPYPLINGNSNTNFSSEEKEYFEMGTDLIFFNSIIGFTANYFSNRIENNIVPSPTPSTGLSVVYMNVGNIKTSGIELILNSKNSFANNINYNTSLIWSTLKSEIEGLGSGNGNPLLLGSPYPDWRGSLFNQITWRNVFFSCLVETSRGGTFFTGSINNLTVADGSYTKVRDVSIGYYLSQSFNKKLGLSKTWLSASFRNPIIYTPHSFDAEMTGTGVIQKSISINLYTSF